MVVTPSRKMVIFLGDGANGIVLTTLFICILHLQLATNPHGRKKETNHQGHQVKTIGAGRAGPWTRIIHMYI